MAERRKNDTKPARPSQPDQRNEDRRDSIRVPMKFLVRDVSEGGSYVEREGDLSLGGIYWRGKTAPFGTEVEVRFRLTGVPKEVKAKGEIIRVKEVGGDVDFHVRFTELDVESELAVARFLEDAAKAAQ
jgi:uncharacterized protein (TIGR02266 family)